MRSNNFSIYQPLGKITSSYDDEKSARERFHDIVGDAVLMDRGNILDKKVYIKEFDHLIHAALNVICGENIPMPEKETIDIYKNILELFKTPGKGVLLCGSIGIGKTTIMKVISMAAMSGYVENVKPFRVIPIRKIAKSYLKKDGDPYKEYQIGEGYPNHNICLDDIGIEEVQLKLFGNNVALVPDLVMELYENFTSPYKTITHFTTNLFPSEIESTYGVRTYDRIIQMINLFTIDGDSKRI